MRALTRDPASARLPDGVEVVRGDLGDPGGLDGALQGVDSVFLVWPTLSADHAASETIAAIGRRVRRVVYLSARGVHPDAAPDTILGSHARLEGLIEKAGVGWTFLRAGGFASNTLMWASQIKNDGVVRWFFGDMVRPLIHERDIAAVGVGALVEDGHDGAKYVLTGPERISQREQVAVIGAAAGKEVRWEELGLEEARADLLQRGLSPTFAASLLDGQAAMLRDPESVTSTVEAVTGVPARSFRSWADEHAGDFR